MHVTWHKVMTQGPKCEHKDKLDSYPSITDVVLDASQCGEKQWWHST